MPVISTPITLWLLLAAAAPRQADDASRGTFARVIECVQAGSFAAAVAEAEREHEPVRRAQALLYALHAGGDLVGALRAGIAGLESAPDDSWLLERVVYIALSLRETDLAAKYGAGLESVVTRMPADSAERARLQQCLRDYAPQIRELRGLFAQRDRAILRARGTLAIGVLAAAAVAVALARRGR